MAVNLHQIILFKREEFQRYQSYICINLKKCNFSFADMSCAPKLVLTCIFFNQVVNIQACCVINKKSINLFISYVFVFNNFTVDVFFNYS